MLCKIKVWIENNKKSEYLLSSSEDIYSLWTLSYYLKGGVRTSFFHHRINEG